MIFCNVGTVKCAIFSSSSMAVFICFWPDQVYHNVGTALLRVLPGQFLSVKLPKNITIIVTVKLHKRGPLLQTAGHPFSLLLGQTSSVHVPSISINVGHFYRRRATLFPCYLASPVLPSCLLPPSRWPTVCQNRLGHQNYYF